jgi:hypothetical protein
MIYFFLKSSQVHTVQAFLESWGRDLSENIRIIFYDDPPERTPTYFREGTAIFTDTERLTGSERWTADYYFKKLSDPASKVRVLNKPGRTLGRLELLREMTQAGLNDFRACRLTDNWRSLRYPIFFRCSKEHTGNLSPLLYSESEAVSSMRKLLREGRPMSAILAVEYLDTSDKEGIFRKYSAFFIGGKIIPRHLVFSRQWMLKTPDLIDNMKLKEEEEYLRGNPHQDWIRKVFEIARTDYGRIDYALDKGRPQLWEINTAPILMLHPDFYQKPHLENQRIFLAELTRALEFFGMEKRSSEGMNIRAPLPILGFLKFRKKIGSLKRAFFH